MRHREDEREREGPARERRNKRRRAEDRIRITDPNSREPLDGSLLGALSVTLENSVMDGWAPCGPLQLSIRVERADTRFWFFVSARRMRW